jgi:hypothetical protein
LIDLRDWGSILTPLVLWPVLAALVVWLLMWLLIHSIPNLT